MLGAKLDKNPQQKWQEKPKSSGIYKNSLNIQQGSVKLWWSISCRSGVRRFFNCSIYIWYNFKALVLRRNIKMLQNENKKIPYVQVRQKNAKS